MCISERAEGKRLSTTMDNFVPATETLDPQPRRKRYLRLLLIVAIVVVCVIVISLIVINFVFSSINQIEATDTTDQPVETEVAPLSEQTILATLESADITAPDLSGYTYIDTSNLTGPQFRDITVGEAFINGATQETYRVINATATYHNTALVASIELLQRFIYDSETNTWIPGDISQSGVEVVPQKALATSTIKEILPTLLEEYDKTLADQFEDCEYLLTPTLTADGGTVKAVLNKIDNDQLLSCTVNLVVIWNQSSGWEVSISWAGDVETSEIDEDSENINYGSDNISELSGVIEMRDDVVLLRTDDEVQIETNNSFETDDDTDEDEEDTNTQDTWSTDLFELILDDTSFEVTSEMYVTVKGTLAMSDVFEDVPFAITVTDIAYS